MPLFGHKDAPANYLRSNEQVLGQWKTHHGELQLTSQRCLMLKSTGMMGANHHEIAWGLELDQIQNLQLVGGNANVAAQAAGNAAGQAAYSIAPISIGNPFGGLSGANHASLVINGQSVSFHNENDANLAQTQIQGAKDARMRELGKS